VVDEGQAAPELELPSETGERISLSSLRGRPVVRSFSPSPTDDSPSPVESVSP
jgi:peroxiredoxin